MQVPIGTSNFREWVQLRLRFVDKTSLIKDIIDSANVKVSLITRPRRFSKTANLSMLHYFLAAQSGSVEFCILHLGLSF